ncbi:MULTISPECIES: mannose-1-phosphate guanylyltransferase/mannose-6-phosphate isomerase [unclassified Pseudoalteromonas]|uniref:mannose-1-phosphate guanylyltransferase/mannose-6-phosphate isomerase n=1 Tax=unclassified Pseudoalteromonas TaxID=194690 RepID=UPI00110998EF|nr:MULTISPECIES: mannose-1-phosphate guanylyltransferase/mannose-6-phosphate isomerase [unclassified Pseudoalteromonas]TMN78109.1 mannose-1-phosphate guanylyltransferase/mannose-6-phosphate isomerase [Pseudoalteromonas sp. S410]TMN90461.1 mannose-1-phosphate guanylyltransferase/mannose-6-phosphate isomerase [Pseudoalteromonas sp. S408]TMN96459.1 mannose-1-phosphate guanylyltransferase/mannose-6-phosphate isomerase [Pseudoalteromonas sp. S407]TMO00614.1 mannose-1-phosphate guanylyltransferase/ma
MITPIIMAGGTGSRLWPLSRELYPKQFLTVATEVSMLQQTVMRLNNIEHTKPLLICNEEHRFIAAEQMRVANLEHAGIILEPVGRNTAPAIALAALQALNSAHDGEDPVLLVLAADHVIEDITAFEKAVKKALPIAIDNKLITFGIVPTAPETGYGYIKLGEQFDSAFTVNQFVEKPNLETAEKYINSGNYLWNSGMFMFKASRYIEELAKYAPEILSACERSIATQSEDLEFIRVNKESFECCPDNSIDYAVMEKSKDVMVVPMDAGWSDVGSFSALWDISDKDANKNALKGDVITIESTNNYINAENKLVATVGVDNLVVIETKDAILVANKDKVQDVKKVVNELKRRGRTEHKIHREVYRPWGKYDSIDHGKRDQVKRITVNPGEKLSIQKHHHRSEHWIVVSGTASVLNGDKTNLVSENESTYIPLGTIHALENPGKIPLEMIEVQTGSYLGEDDIVRFEDRYGRV